MSWSETSDRTNGERERENTRSGEAHVSPLHTRSALVTCIILRWFMRPRYVSARVFILSLSAPLGDPSAIPSSLSLSFPVALVAWSAVCARLEGARHGEMERERKEDAVGTLARKGGRRGAGRAKRMCKRRVNDIT